VGLPANECRRLRAALRKLPPLPPPPRVATAAPANAAVSRRLSPAHSFGEASRDGVGDVKNSKEVENEEGGGIREEVESEEIRQESAHAHTDANDRINNEGIERSNDDASENDYDDKGNEDDESADMARSRAQGSWWVEEPPSKSSASAYPPTRRFAAPTLRGRGVRPRIMQQQQQAGAETSVCSSYRLQLRVVKDQLNNFVS